MKYVGFTPTVEVDFAGMRLLRVLSYYLKDFTEKKTLNFHVRNLGLFVVHQDEDGKIRMDFPIRKAQQVEDYPAILRQALTKPLKRFIKIFKPTLLNMSQCKMC